MTEARDALLAAADEIERELICCDAFEQGPDHLRRSKNRYPHEICYWAGASRAIILKRAEGLTRG